MTARRLSGCRQQASWVGEAKGADVTSEQQISPRPTGRPLQHSSSRRISVDSGTVEKSTQVQSNKATTRGNTAAIAAVGS